MLAYCTRSVVHRNLSSHLCRISKCFSSESANTGDKNNESDEACGANAELAQLKASVGDLSSELQNMKDKYMRALAETENVRIRLTKEIAAAKKFGIQSFCKDLLDVVDVLQAARNSVTKDQLDAANNDLLKTLHDGVCLTETQLHKVLQRNGMVKIVPQIGETFDPNTHEALFNIPAAAATLIKTPGGEPPASGTVAVVEKIGFSLHVRTLRPALVGVVST